MHNLTKTDSASVTPMGVRPALALGVSITSGAWIAWFLLHLPALAAPPILSVPVIAAVWLSLAVLLGRRWGLGPREGLIGGIIAAGLGLLLLGSMLVSPSDQGDFTSGEASFRASSLLVVGAYLAGGAALAAIGCVLGGGRRAFSGSQPWTARLAWGVAASFVPLIIIGGVVTSTESGMAVHDWPSTFGANMFLYPQELMQQQSRVYYEHMHRLFGSLAGLCTVVLLIATLTDRSARGRYGTWAVVLFVAVSVQGYLGGQRVLQNNPYLGAVHGVFGQLIFAYACTLALWMSPRFADLPRLDIAQSRRARSLTTAALHSTILQLTLGAIYRHLRRGDGPGSSHIAWTHVAFSIVVVALAVLAGSMLIRVARDHADQFPDGLARGLRRLGASVHGIVGLQFALGWAALLVVMTGAERGDVPTADALEQAADVPVEEVIATTLHHANGALLLVILMLCWAWGRRIHRAATA